MRKDNESVNEGYKSSLTRFSTSGFFMNQVPPNPWVFHWGCFVFLQRYSRMNVYHRCRRHRRWAVHRSKTPAILVIVTDFQWSPVSFTPVENNCPCAQWHLKKTEHVQWTSMKNVIHGGSCPFMSKYSRNVSIIRAVKVTFKLKRHLVSVHTISYCRIPVNILKKVVPSPGAGASIGLSDGV